MKNLFIIFFFFNTLHFLQPLQGQNIITIYGQLNDSLSHESLAGANITINELKTGTVTNKEGMFSLSVPKGNYTIVIDYLGYRSIRKVIQADKDVSFQFMLQAEKELLKEVEVSAEASDRNVSSNEMSITKLSMKDIKKMPALLGEVDVIRSIQLTPGVSTIGEGATGFNVRGGSIDQNLILMDDAPVYNSSHLFGFFSIFNPDAVKEVRLFKGGIPAQYGGRISSLLDVKLKEGSPSTFGVNGGIGTVSSRLSLETPIVKDKGSFIITGRRSYADLFLKFNPDLKDNQAYFYDLSAKANYNINKRDKIFLSGYYGRDVFKFGKEFENSWGNTLASLRWNHLYNSRLSSNISLIWSKFDYQLGIPQGTQGFDWKSYIENFNLKTDFSYQLTQNSTLNFGAGFINYTFDPGKVKPVGDKSIFKGVEMLMQYGQEYVLYLSNNQKISSRWSVEYGLRYSGYNFLGAGASIYSYNTGELGKQKIPDQGNYYAKGKSINYYQNFEPRLSTRFTLNESSSVKLSYNRTAQYVHLLSNTTAASPLDIWVSTTNNVKPQLGDQVAAGYFRNMKDNTYEISGEVFYKYMQNQIDYINGAQLLLNKNVEADLLYGIGRAYGLELYARKIRGKLTGWVSYTLSKTEKKIDGISNNRFYRAKYDKPHNLSIVAMVEVSPRWTISGSFALSSGVTTTFPDARYEFQGVIVPDNSQEERNNYRLPSYHRLDLGATYKFKNKGKLKKELVFSLYNAYGRRNPYTIFFRQNETNAQKTEAVRLSILGSPLPSITYNFQF